MRILRPLRTNRITQGFGENKVPYYREAGMLGHNGIDFVCWRGEPMYHSGDFVGIAKTEVDMAGGIGVDIISKEPFEDGFHRKLRYWHLLKVAVYDGQEIRTGNLVGLGDNTGMSTGDHLHFGYKRCLKDGTAVNKDNGYYGGLDPEPYYIDEFVKIKLPSWLLLYRAIRSAIIKLKYVGFL